MGLPEYLDVDEFFRGAQRTVPLGRDVRRDVNKEIDRNPGMDPWLRRYNEDWGYLADKPVGV